jgi:hypothetical protein
MRDVSKPDEKCLGYGEESEDDSSFERMVIKL